MTFGEGADEERYVQSRSLPPRELRELLQRVFLGSADGRAVFSYMLFRYHGEAPILTERQLHEHNLIVDLKNLIGWGHTQASVVAQVEALAADMSVLSLEDYRNGEIN